MNRNVRLTALRQPRRAIRAPGSLWHRADCRWWPSARALPPESVRERHQHLEQRREQSSLD